jgi:predicted ArsR family transcriptional regulator
VDEPADQERRIGRIAALDQPLRRDLYALLVARGAWVTRDEAAAALDVARSVAAFHLDKLAEAGVVEVSYERTSGRTGPGAGRPSKRYRRSGDEVSASVPDRHYDLAGSLLATAIAESTRTGDPVTQCLSATAHAAGRRAGEEALGGGDPPVDPLARREAVRALLAEHGYEPGPCAGGDIALLNCPFHRLAEAERSLVCGMNLDYLTGMLEPLAEPPALGARLEPEAGHCCVRISAA